MSQCLPFSDIDRILENNSENLFCLADTSFLIAISDEDHKKYEDAQFLFEKLVEYNAKIFVSVTARSEFIDYARRTILTENLMGMIAPSSKWKISAAVSKELKSQLGWINNQLNIEGEPIALSDSRLKDCKQVFLPKTQSGQIGWVEFCKEYLAGKLLLSWERVVELLDLNYIDMRSSDAKELFRKELHWDSMCRLAEEGGLGSQDAMILI